MTVQEVLRPAPVAGSPGRVWSSRQWSEYYREAAGALLVIPWARGAELTSAEREAIAPSLQVFQQGESQEGGHFFRCAREYAEQAGDGDYAEAHQLFMQEEKRHARDLGRFLDLAGVPRLTKRSWLTFAFCWCGSRGRLEPTLLIIVMSEIIAQAYYAVLRRATGSRVLRRLCSQILRDEKQHVRFQCERLALIRRHRRGWRLTLTEWLDHFLFAGAALACWCGHRRTLRTGGCGFLAFWRQARRHLRSAWKIKDPRAYAWID